MAAGLQDLVLLGADAVLGQGALRCGDVQGAQLAVHLWKQQFQG